MSPQQTIAHYRIISKLGEGGMGEVWRATDTKLGREVAIKVLPESFAADADRMARFQREAQVLASLNHPNIAAIYGVEERALVMELVEGATLAERIAPGPVPLEDALPIARQIAEGLEYAHERGIIHRDLKPANIKVTPEGRVKILDFGLAKALSSEPASADPSTSPTLTMRATTAGLIVGTAAYMAPEQARGKSVDRRADIWAFGVVLYEMLTGKPAFGGETITDVLATVVKEEPDLTRVPVKLRRLLKACLEKDPKLRLQAIGDWRLLLEETQPVAGSSHSTRIPWTLAATLALLAAGILAWLWLAPRTRTLLTTVAYIPPPPGTSFRFYGFSAGPVVVSPDGTKLAFSATDEKGVTKIWVRPLAGAEARELAGTEDGGALSWSPDSQSLGFLADQKLKTITVEGGTLKVLADANCGSGAWISPETILFVPRCGGPIEAISATGGNARPVIQPASASARVGEASPLPGSDEFLYVSRDKDFAPSIGMASLSTGKSKPVLPGASSPQFASGRLLFLRGEKLFAQRFDRRSGKLSGEAMPLGEAQTYSVSANGVLAFQGGKPDSRLEWFDRNGNALAALGEVNRWYSPRISPDGKRVLATASDLWSYPAKGGVGTRLTFAPGDNGFSVWSPDGKHIAYPCHSGGTMCLCRKPSDGSGAEETLLKLPPDLLAASVVDWSPDGRYLSFDELGGDHRWSNWILPLETGQKPFRPAPVNEDQFDGNFSPDGKWIAYFSYETGRPEVFVVPFPSGGGKFQISQTGGWGVRWAGRDKLFFLTMASRLMEANLAVSGKSLQVESIQPLFQLDLQNQGGPPYDVMPDGSRFIVAASVDPNASRSITLLLNWEAEVKGK